MGDPKKTRKLYRGPSHPWQKERLESEILLLKEYGLKNKKELWKVDSLLKNYMRQAKRLIALGGEQAEKERRHLLAKLQSLGLLESESGVADVLGISLKSLLERRLQTILHRKHLARSVIQARQFIVHEHVLVGEKKLTVPSYLVSVSEEASISMAPGSSLANPEHPERAAAKVASSKKEEVVVEDKGKENPKKDTNSEKAESKKDTKKEKAEAKKDTKKEKAEAKKDAKEEKAEVKEETKEEKSE
ncbi:MAG: 30S ribosomal protein S4 [Nanoarchaeota archaeon]|nr:30S ribosomal protein S4 [Nanoarchaeota archaeon]